MLYQDVIEFCNIEDERKKILNSKERMNVSNLNIYTKLLNFDKNKHENIKLELLDIIRKAEPHLKEKQMENLNFNKLILLYHNKLIIGFIKFNEINYKRIIHLEHVCGRIKEYKGIFKPLLHKLELHCKKKGFKSITLCYVHNDLKNYYEKFGFKPVKFGKLRKNNI